MEEKSISKILLDLRERSGMKQFYVARKLGMSQQQYSRYESGTSELPLRAIPVLAELYSVSAEYILGMSDALGAASELQQMVTEDQSAKEVLADLMSLNEESRKYVSHYIFKQKFKENVIPNITDRQLYELRTMIDKEIAARQDESDK